MDEHRFDQLTQALSRFLSRRSVTGLGIAGSLGLMLGQGEDAGAKKARCLGPGQKCQARTRKKARCCGGSRCKNRRCRCPKGQKPCRKRCCPKGQSCVGGRCVKPLICQAGQVKCGTACRNLSTDSSACGACGNICATGEECRDGECDCRVGFQRCSGVCVNLSFDGNNCAQCGRVCPPEFSSCSSAQCCTGIGETCNVISDQCCGFSFCKRNGQGIVGICCIAVGDPCDGNDDCCSDNCDGGICRGA